MWMLDAPLQLESCFCLPKHISEDIQVSFTQLHWLLCPTKNVSMVYAAYQVQKKPNVIVFSDYVSLSFISWEYSFGLTDYGYISESMKHFHRIKEEIGNNYMV